MSQDGRLHPEAAGHQVKPGEQQQCAEPAVLASCCAWQVHPAQLPGQSAGWAEHPAADWQGAAADAAAVGGCCMHASAWAAAASGRQVVGGAVQQQQGEGLVNPAAWGLPFAPSRICEWRSRTGQLAQTPRPWDQSHAHCTLQPGVVAWHGALKQLAQQHPRPWGQVGAAGAAA
jgi:hypothetical protein